MSNYRWRVGDVFTDGSHRWRVVELFDGGEQAVLQSCASSWAKTIPLRFREWHEGHRWQLEPSTSSQEPTA